jgi:WD40 repeat protein
VNGYGGVTAVAIHPNQTIAASAGGDGVIRLWNLPGGESAGTLMGHHFGSIDALVFSPDGRLLASGSEDATIRLWDMTTRKEKAELKGHTGWVSSLSFSPDGKVLASASGDRRIILWNVAEVRVIREIIGHTDVVRSVVFDATRPILYSASEDQTVRVWDTETGLPSGKVADGQFRVPNEHRLKQLILGRHGHELLGTDGIDEVQRWTIEETNFGKHKGLRSVLGHVRRACLAEIPHWNEERHVLIRGTEEGSLSMAGFNGQGFEPKPLLGHSTQIDALAVSKNARCIISGDSAGKLLLWNFDPLWPVTLRPVPTSTHVEVVDLSSDGEYMIWADSENVYRQPFDQSSPPVRLWAHDFATPLNLDLSPLGDLVMLHHDRTYSVRSIDSRDELFREELPDQIESVAIAPDSTWVAIAHGQKLFIKNLTDKRVPHRHTIASTIHSMHAINADSLFAACEDGVLRRISIIDGKETLSIACDPQPLSAVRLSPDGNIVAVGGANVASILDAKTGRLLANLPQHTRIYTLLFLDNGRRLLTNDGDPRTRLWDLESYQYVGTLEPFDFEGNLTPSADGLRFCCRTYGYHLLLLDARPE